jgi:hypothetical protein
MQEMEKEQKMKKAILICALLLCLLMCSCGATVTREEDNIPSENTSMFIVLEETITWQIVYHKDTKVMYAVSIGYYNCGNVTLLVNADGTPMVYEGGSGK